MEEASQVNCVACREPIREGALVCPHCRTQQHPKRWEAVGRFLKWVAGTTAVLSLVAGSLQLNTLYQDWRKKEKAIKGYVTAARMQYSTGNLQGAHQLLEMAEELDPLSSEVLAFQADLVMEKLREYYSSNRQADWVMTYKLYEDDVGKENYNWSGRTSKRKYVQDLFEEQGAANKLALASVHATGERKAQLLSHSAWLDSLVGSQRESHHIESLFISAIEADPDNAFARIMYAAWLMEYYRYEEDPDNRLSSAIHHLSNAAPDREQERWFNAFMLKLLSLPDYSPRADIQVLKTVSTFDAIDLSSSMASDSLEKLNKLLSASQRNRQVNARQARNQLRQEIPDHELAALVERLGLAAFGCSPWDFSCDPKIHVRILFNFFDAATTLYEQMGRCDEASKASLMVWLARRRANYDAKPEHIASMIRNLEASGTPATSTLAVAQTHRDGDFAVGDVVTHVNGIRLYRADELVALYRDEEHKAPYDVTVIRGGRTISLEMSERPDRYARFVDYVVPVSLLADGDTPQIFADMHAAWTSD